MPRSPNVRQAPSPSFTSRCAPATTRSGCTGHTASPRSASAVPITAARPASRMTHIHIREISTAKPYCESLSLFATARTPYMAPNKGKTHAAQDRSGSPLQREGPAHYRAAPSHRPRAVRGG
ncbi:hypothetical protein SPHINGO391_390169 [Sphingomonas aurantiaca]|uniref:Uncharacterized protein n=1 Tax=Sphingomonas aurantiaca TaxID=185949 RepID=A0A5E7YNE0_9SPHN|nr:hypothetical protein SPHINGO391_390169 [Sphingomonas aurantiaca]